MPAIIDFLRMRRTAKKKNTADVPGARSLGGTHRTRSARARWGNRENLFLEGFLVVPNTFLRRYASLRPALTHGEALFVLHLMSFKWDDAAPHPTYKTIAGLMGVNEKTVQRYAQSLCRKKYLFRIFQDHAPNRFDLSPLFAALASPVGPQVDAPTDYTAELVDIETAMKMLL